MKMKEVCARTELTERTVRFYMEKELVLPETEWRNGREYTEFSEKDISALLAVATLRSLDFSIEEIRTMQKEPGAIPQTVEARRLSARQEQALAQDAARILDGLDPSGAENVEELAARIRAVSRQAPSAPPRPLPASDQGNNSGMGERCNQIPMEIQDKWNWGAFLMPIPWGIGNRVYQTFLCLIPVIGIFAAFYFGSKGNTLAWKQKCWEDVPHFRRVQRLWAGWAIGINAAILALNIILTVSANRKQKEKEALSAHNQAMVFAAIENTEEWRTLTEARTRWEKGRVGLPDGPGEQFYLEEAAYRLSMESFIDWPILTGGDMKKFQYTAIVEYSNGQQWDVSCEAGLDYAVELIEIKEDPSATAENQKIIAAYDRVISDQKEYLEKITAQVTGSKEWRDAIGMDYTFAQGYPMPGAASYGAVYSGGSATFEGFYAEVLAKGVRFRVRLSDDGTAYSTNGKIEITQIEDQGA